MTDKYEDFTKLMKYRMSKKFNTLAVVEAAIFNDALEVDVVKLRNHLAFGYSRSGVNVLQIDLPKKEDFNGLAMVQEFNRNFDNIGVSISGLRFENEKVYVDLRGKDLSELNRISTSLCLQQIN